MYQATIRQSKKKRQALHINFPQDENEFIGVVIGKFGDGRCECVLDDGRSIKASIRGAIKRKGKHLTIINNRDLVLINWLGEDFYVINGKYTDKQINELEKSKSISSHIVQAMKDDIYGTTEEYNESNDMIHFANSSDEDIDIDGI